MFLCGAQVYQCVDPPAQDAAFLKTPYQSNLPREYRYEFTIFLCLIFYFISVFLVNNKNIKKPIPHKQTDQQVCPSSGCLWFVAVVVIEPVAGYLDCDRHWGGQDMPAAPPHEMHHLITQTHTDNSQPLLQDYSITDR